MANILNKEGLLSDEDRKHPLEHDCRYFTFKTILDLTEPVKVIPYGNASLFSVNDYTRDIASFIVWWTKMVLVDLNGFSGFHNVKFELVDFDLMKL